MKFVTGKIGKVNADDCDFWPIGSISRILVKNDVCMMIAEQERTYYIIILFDKQLGEILPEFLDEL